MKPALIPFGILIVALNAPCLAYPPDFGPFEPGTAPTNSCVRKWIRESDGDLAWVHRPQAGATAFARILQTSEPDPHFDLAFDITIVAEDGRVLLSHAPFPGLYQAETQSVYSGLINDDQIPDYVVLSDWGTGMGILGWHFTVVFVLSGPNQTL